MARKQQDPSERPPRYPIAPLGPKQQPLVNPREMPIPPHLQAEAAEVFKREKAPNTRAAHRSDWKNYSEWCISEGRTMLPATPGTVIGYLTHLKVKGHPWSTITRRLSTISRAHMEKGHDSPRDSMEVRKFCRGLRRVLRVATHKKQALTREELERVADAAKTGDLIGLRDEALILLGFAMAARRSELSGLNVENLEFSVDGLRVFLVSSKTDQEGEGTWLGIPRDASRTVDAVGRWVKEAGFTTGPLFRGFTLKKKIMEKRLTPKGVGKVILRLFVRAGVMVKPRRKRGGPRREFTHGAHSLRSGFITSAKKGGVAIDDIMTQSRHESVKQVRSYIQKTDVFENNPAKGVAL